MNPETQRTLLTVRQFAAKHTAFTEASLRYLIFQSKPSHPARSKSPIPGNGLDVALVRIGRRIYIDEKQFFAWADAQSNRTAAPPPGWPAARSTNRARP